jgi:hypothetical protein
MKETLDLLKLLVETYITCGRCCHLFCSPALAAAHKLRVLINRVLRRIFEPKMDGVKGLEKIVQTQR